MGLYAACLYPTAALVLFCAAAAAAAAPAREGGLQESGWVFSEGLSSMLKAVDGIYIVNLDRSSDRLNRITKQIQALGAGSAWRRVRAVDGSLFSTTVSVRTATRTYAYGGLDVTVWNFEGLEGPKGPHAEKAACTLSHLKAICMAYHDGLATALILEDDVNLTAGDQLGAGDVAAVLGALPKDFSILQLSAAIVTRSMVDMLKKDFNKGYLARRRDSCGSDSSLWGTYAYIISRKGMRELLERFWPEALLQYGDSTAYDGCYGGSGALWPIGLKGSFDLTAVTHFMADYLLYRMKNVFVMTRPALLPSNGFGATYTTESGSNAHVERARRLYLEAFDNSTAAPTPMWQSENGTVYLNSVISNSKRNKVRIHYTGKKTRVTQSELELRTDGACQAYFGDTVQNDPECAYLTAALWVHLSLCGNDEPGISGHCKRQSSQCPGLSGLEDQMNIQVSSVPVPEVEVEGDAEVADFLDVCLIMSGYYQLIEVCESTGGDDQYCKDLDLAEGQCKVLTDLWPSILAKGRAEYLEAAG